METPRHDSSDSKEMTGALNSPGITESFTSLRTIIENMKGGDLEIDQIEKSFDFLGLAEEQFQKLAEQSQHIIHLKGQIERLEKLQNVKIESINSICNTCQDYKREKGDVTLSCGVFSESLQKYPAIKNELESDRISKDIVALQNQIQTLKKSETDALKDKKWLLENNVKLLQLINTLNKDKFNYKWQISQKKVNHNEPVQNVQHALKGSQMREFLAFEKLEEVNFILSQVKTDIFSYGDEISNLVLPYEIEEESLAKLLNDAVSHGVRVSHQLNRMNDQVEKRDGTIKILEGKLRSLQLKNEKMNDELKKEREVTKSLMDEIKELTALLAANGKVIMKDLGNNSGNVNNQGLECSIITSQTEVHSLLEIRSSLRTRRQHNFEDMSFQAVIDPIVSVKKKTVVEMEHSSGEYKKEKEDLKANNFEIYSEEKNKISIIEGLNLEEKKQPNMKHEVETLVLEKDQLIQRLSKIIGELRCEKELVYTKLRQMESSLESIIGFDKISPHTSAEEDFSERNLVMLQKEDIKNLLNERDKQPLEIPFIKEKYDDEKKGLSNEVQDVGSHSVSNFAYNLLNGKKGISKVVQDMESKLKETNKSIAKYSNVLEELECKQEIDREFENKGFMEVQKCKRFSLFRKYKDTQKEQNNSLLKALKVCTLRDIFKNKKLNRTEEKQIITESIRKKASKRPKILQILNKIKKPKAIENNTSENLDTFAFITEDADSRCKIITYKNEEAKKNKWTQDCRKVLIGVDIEELLSLINKKDVQRQELFQLKEKFGIIKESVEIKFKEVQSLVEENYQQILAFSKIMEGLDDKKKGFFEKTMEFETLMEDKKKEMLNISNSLDSVKKELDITRSALLSRDQEIADLLKEKQNHLRENEFSKEELESENGMLVAKLEFLESSVQSKVREIRELSLTVDELSNENDVIDQRVKNLESMLKATQREEMKFSSEEKDNQMKELSILLSEKEQELFDVSNDQILLEEKQNQFDEPSNIKEKKQLTSKQANGIELLSEPYEEQSQDIIMANKNPIVEQNAMLLANNQKNKLRSKTNYIPSPGIQGGCNDENLTSIKAEISDSWIQSQSEDIKEMSKLVGKLNIEETEERIRNIESMKEDYILEKCSPEYKMETDMEERIIHIRSLKEIEGQVMKDNDSVTDKHTAEVKLLMEEKGDEISLARNEEAFTTVEDRISTNDVKSDFKEPMDISEGSTEKQEHMLLVTDQKMDTTIETNVIPSSVQLRNREILETYELTGKLNNEEIEERALHIQSVKEIEGQVMKDTNSVKENHSTEIKSLIEDKGTLMGEQLPSRLEEEAFTAKVPEDRILSNDKKPNFKEPSGISEDKKHDELTSKDVNDIKSLYGEIEKKIQDSINSNEGFTAKQGSMFLVNDQKIDSTIETNEIPTHDSPKSEDKFCTSTKSTEAELTDSILKAKKIDDLEIHELKGKLSNEGKEDIIFHTQSLDDITSQEMTNNDSATEKSTTVIGENGSLMDEPLSDEKEIEAFTAKISEDRILANDKETNFQEPSIIAEERKHNELASNQVNDIKPLSEETDTKIQDLMNANEGFAAETGDMLQINDEKMKEIIETPPQAIPEIEETFYNDKSMWSDQNLSVSENVLDIQEISLHIEDIHHVKK